DPRRSPRRAAHEVRVSDQHEDRLGPWPDDSSIDSCESGRSYPVITRRTLLCRLTLGTVAAPLVGEAQSGGKAYRIGYLGNTSALAQATRVESLRAALRDLGYEEGKNIVIEFRWAEGKLDRLPALAAELVRLNVDVLVTAGTPGALAAKQAT